MLDAATIDGLGRILYDAERLRRPRRPLSDEFPELDPASAYAAQEAYAALRLSDSNPLVGRKIGATSRAIQELFDIDTPDYGQIFADMVVDDGATIAIDELIAPMVEPEVAFRLRTDLAGPGVSADDVQAVTNVVAPCLEIIDSRIVDWRIRFVDTVADNGSSARCVFGREVAAAELDLAAETVALYHDDELVGAATGAAALGHPCASVAWLANALGGLGRTLRAGEWVLSGSLTSAVRATPGARFRAEFGSIGDVSCAFA
jgi:2-keto-4-pentenoate hydratase